MSDNSEMIYTEEDFLHFKDLHIRLNNECAYAFALRQRGCSEQPPVWSHLGEQAAGVDVPRRKINIPLRSTA